jgi:hypothetical protein
MTKNRAILGPHLQKNNIKSIGDIYGGIFAKGAVNRAR